MHEVTDSMHHLKKTQNKKMYPDISQIMHLISRLSRIIQVFFDRLECYFSSETKKNRGLRKKHTKPFG